MKTVWKFTLQVGEPVQMPEGSKILSVGEQYGAINIWAMVDATMPTVNRRFLVAGTGHEIPNDEVLEFIGTVLLSGGEFVFHVFERLEGEDHE